MRRMGFEPMIVSELDPDSSALTTRPSSLGGHNSRSSKTNYMVVPHHTISQGLKLTN